MKLTLEPSMYAVAQLSAQEPFPNWCRESSFFSITRTTEELSIVCEEKVLPAEVKAERGWRMFKVAGPLDFSLTGILASIATPLANAKVSLFAISTFNTDYVLIKAADLAAATDVLRSAGFSIS